MNGTGTEPVVKVKKKRPSYKTLYKNEMKNHQLTRDFYEKLVCTLREPVEAQASWYVKVKEFFS